MDPERRAELERRAEELFEEDEYVTVAEIEGEREGDG